MSRTSRRTERRRIAAAAGSAPARDFAPDYGYVRSDLRRIGVLAAGLLSLLVVLAFILR